MENFITGYAGERVADARRGARRARRRPRRASSSSACSPRSSARRTPPSSPGSASTACASRSTTATSSPTRGRSRSSRTASATSTGRSTRWRRARRLLDRRPARAARRRRTTTGTRTTRPTRALFWEHPHFQDRVVHLWEAIADHYRDNPWVAGYNLHERAGRRVARRSSGPSTRRLVAAIRAVDPDHILFLDGNTYSTEFDFFDEPLEQRRLHAARLRPRRPRPQPHEYDRGGRRGRSSCSAPRTRAAPGRRSTSASSARSTPATRRRRLRAADPRRPARPLPAARRRLVALDVQGPRPPGPVPVRPDSPYRRRFDDFVAKKNRLGADQWGSDGIGDRRGHPARPGSRGARVPGLRPVPVGPRRLGAHAAAQHHLRPAAGRTSTPSCSAVSTTTSSTRSPTPSRSSSCAVREPLLDQLQREPDARVADEGRGAPRLRRAAAAGGRRARRRRAPARCCVRIEAAGVCHSDLHYMTGDLRARCPSSSATRAPAWSRPSGAGVERRRARRPGRAAVAAALRAMRVLRRRPPVLCELGRVQATHERLPDDGTTRLRRGGEQMHHLMGVSCFAEQVVVSREVGRATCPTACRRGSPPSRPAPSSPAWAPCSTWSGECAGARAARAGRGRRRASSAVMGARLAGADPVIVVDLDPQARAGPAAGRRRRSSTPAARTWSRRSWRPCRAACPGRSRPSAGPETLQQAVACLRPGGTLVAVGLGRVGATVARADQRSRAAAEAHGRQPLRLRQPARRPAAAVRLYLAGRLPLDELLGAEYPLEAINEAYAALTGGAVGRAVVVPAP